MIVAIVIAACLVAAILAESVFCFVMRRHSRKKAAVPAAEPAAAQPPAEKRKVSLARRAFNCCYRWAEDLTYLFGKIVGYLPANWLRNFFYRFVFSVKMGKWVSIRYGLELIHPWKLEIGDHTVIGAHTILDARSGIRIGKNVNFGHGVHVWTLQHDINSPTFGIENQGKPVEIGDRVWLSEGTVVLPGVTVSEGTVLAAGGILTKSTDLPFGLWGGGTCPPNRGTESRSYI